MTQRHRRDELGAKSEPPCLSVIAMPIVTARFLGQWQRARIVVAGKKLRLPLLGELRVVAQYPHRGEGHGYRAGDAIFRPGSTDS